MGTSTVSKDRKNKAAKSALAVALALLLALGGTLAWASFSQVARNEFKASANPGGRLHDDFIWTDGVKNKDVYVENFTDETNGGQNIYARVQLREFLEIGTGAGEYAATAPSGLTRYPSQSASSTDNSTWKVHKLDESAAGESDFHQYFKFSYGGATKYMPTFNKNKDSLEADVNGSLRDEATGRELNYSNYRDWSLPANASVADTAYYDNDDNAADEAATSPGAAPGAGGTAPENYIARDETHFVRDSLGASVVAMTDWKDPNKLNSEPGEYWVYDDTANDGWFYWAQAIAPSTATGKLLDNVIPESKIPDDWYYAIDAIGEFVTAGEVRKDGSDCYFGGENSEGKAMSQDAYDLLTAAAAAAGESTTTGSSPAKGYKVSVARPAPSVSQGATGVAFTASVTEGGNAVAPASVAWSVSGATGTTAIDPATGVLAVDPAQAVGSTLTITATATIGSQTATGVNTVRVVATPALPAALQAVKDAPTANDADAAGDVTGSIVTINNDDGTPVQYVKLAQDGGKVLLLRKDIVDTPKYSGTNVYGVFGTSNIWRDSAARTWCNSAYYNSLPADIKSRLVETDINTKTAYDDDTMITTKDKIFFLTEADIYGTNEGVVKSDSKYYTYGSTSMVPSSLRVANLDGSASDWWLRSPRFASYGVAVVSNDGRGNSHGYDTFRCARPAFWINLAS